MEDPVYFWSNSGFAPGWACVDETGLGIRSEPVFRSCIDQRHAGYGEHLAPGIPNPYFLFSEYPIFLQLFAHSNAVGCLAGCQAVAEGRQDPRTYLRISTHLSRYNRQGNQGCVMKRKFLIGVCLLGLVAMLAWLTMPVLTAPVMAAPLAQYTPYPTPTPMPDGRIIYTAIEGDSAWRIAAIFGFTYDNGLFQELYSLNRWTSGESPVIRAGDQILLGYGGPAEVVPTSGPTPTSPPQLPTPTPEPGSGTLCVILYSDQNGDSLRQEEEPSIPRGAVSISNRAGLYSTTADTASGGEYQCYKELPEGTYNITIALPDGYNETTKMNASIELRGGDEIYMSFGAQENSRTVEGSTTPEGREKSPFLGIAGGVILLLAVGMAVYAGRLLRIK